MDNEWLARYRAHNDALARRLTMKPGDRSGEYAPAQLREFVRRGAEAQRAVDELGIFDSTKLEDIQIAKLFVSRIHKVALKVTDAELRTELYELADDIEERLSR